MESSAKENEVMSKHVPACSAVHIFKPAVVFHVDNGVLLAQTAVEVFKRIILEIEKADGNAPAVEKKCAVM